MNRYIEDYLQETIQIAAFFQAHKAQIEHMVRDLRKVKARGGRLFVVGNGGSAANASHAVNDFRKIACMEAYAPTDNVAELTAWINDHDPKYAISDCLHSCRFSEIDALLVLSVGGGSDLISANLVDAVNFAVIRGSIVLGIVSKDGGYVRQKANTCILVPTANLNNVTPHAENWQMIIVHLLVNMIAQEPA